MQYWVNTYLDASGRAGWAGYNKRFWHNNQNTNLPLEKIHHLLKYIIMGGIANQRPATLLFRLVGRPEKPEENERSMVAWIQRRRAERQSRRHAAKRSAVERQTGRGVLHLHDRQARTPFS